MLPSVRSPGLNTRRQAVRIKELVQSYWPLVSRLKEAEALVKQMRDEVAETERRQREMRQEMDELMWVWSCRVAVWGTLTKP